MRYQSKVDFNVELKEHAFQNWVNIDPSQCGDLKVNQLESIQVVKRKKRQFSPTFSKARWLSVEILLEARLQ